MFRLWLTIPTLAPLLWKISNIYFLFVFYWTFTFNDFADFYGKYGWFCHSLNYYKYQRPKKIIKNEHWTIRYWKVCLHPSFLPTVEYLPSTIYFNRCLLYFSHDFWLLNNDALLHTIKYSLPLMDPIEQTSAWLFSLHLQLLTYHQPIYFCTLFVGWVI